MAPTRTRATNPTPRRRLIGSLLILASLLTGFNARAAEEFVGGGLCRFLPVQYDLTPQIEGTINRIVGKSLQQHQELFGFTLRPDFNVRIRIFGQYADYEAFTLKDRASSYIAHHAGSVSNLSGYYSHHSREVVTWRQQRPGYLANNLLHEASHAILMAHYDTVPVWISEGCATFFSYPTLIQDAEDIGRLKYLWAKLNLWLRSGQLPELETFLNMDHPTWIRQDLTKAYTVSWSLCQHLMATPPRKAILQTLMADLQKEGTDCFSSLNRLHPGGIKQLQTEWHTWIVHGGSRVLGDRTEELIELVKPLK